VVRLLRLRSPLRLAPQRLQAHAAKANCATIRLKLLKIDALVRVSVRRIKLAMASSFPNPARYRIAHARLVAAALTNQTAHSPHTRKRRAANPRRPPPYAVAVRRNAG
jgi:hypothetical protein